MDTALGITNSNVTMNLIYSEQVQELAHRFLDFISPYFEKSLMYSNPDVVIELKPNEQFLARWKNSCTNSVEIRKSSAENFRLTVKTSSRSEDSFFAWDSSLKTGYRFRKSKNPIVLYVGDKSFYHLIEFFRYYVMLVEKSKGSIVLHASAVRRVRDGTIFAICGKKGAGKTTTMLDMVTCEYFEYFSGDKVIVDIHENQLRLRGWPDFPHVGQGSFTHHEKLSNDLSLDISFRDGLVENPSKKLLIDPDIYFSVLGLPSVKSASKAIVLLPNVQSDVSRLRIMDETAKQCFEIDDFIEDPETFITSTWHGLNRHLSHDLNKYQKAKDYIYRLVWCAVSGKKNFSNDLRSITY